MTITCCSARASAGCSPPSRISSSPAIAAPPAEALEILRTTPVDVILLDYDLGGDHGGQFLYSALRAGYRGKTLMVTAGMSAAESSLALKLGASGIFLKHDSPRSLAQAIRQVAAGAMWVDAKVIQSLADNVGFREEQNLRKLLTEREQEVLQGLIRRINQ